MEHKSLQVFVTPQDVSVVFEMMQDHVLCI